MLLPPQRALSAIGLFLQGVASFLVKSFTRMSPAHLDSASVRRSRVRRRVHVDSVLRLRDPSHAANPLNLQVSPQQRPLEALFIVLPLAGGVLHVALLLLLLLLLEPSAEEGGLVRLLLLRKPLMAMVLLGDVLCTLLDLQVRC